MREYTSNSPFLISNLNSCPTDVYDVSMKNNIHKQNVSVVYTEGAAEVAM